jgi:hypothetical protein
LVEAERNMISFFSPDLAYRQAGCSGNLFVESFAREQKIGTESGNMVY